MPHVVCVVFDQSIAASDNRLSYACILLFPKSTKVSFGVPFFARNDRVLRTERNKSLFAENLLHIFRTFFILSRATHFMSFRGVALQRRENLPEGTPYKSDDAMFLPLAKAICLRRDIAFAVILSSTVIFAPRASYGFTLTSAKSQNIILTKSKYHFGASQNITCEANITANGVPTRYCVLVGHNDNTTAVAVVLSFDVFRIKELWIVICVNFGEWEDFRPVRRVVVRVVRLRVVRRVVRPVRRSTARRLPLSYRSPKNLQEGFRPHTDCTCRWLRVRASTGLSPAPVF